MRSRPRSRRFLLALAVGAPLATVAALSGSARADCTVRGTSVLPKTVQLFGSSKGTDVIGTFTGQSVNASVTFAGAARAALKTTGGFRLEGYVDPAAVPLFTARDVTVAEWLDAAGLPGLFDARGRHARAGP